MTLYLYAYILHLSMLKQLLSLISLRCFYEPLRSHGYSLKSLRDLVSIGNFYLIGKLAEEIGFTVTQISLLLYVLSGGSEEELSRANQINTMINWKVDQEEMSSESEGEPIQSQFSREKELEKISAAMRQIKSFESIKEVEMYLRQLKDLGYLYRQIPLGTTDGWFKKIEYGWNKAPSWRSKIVLQMVPKEKEIFWDVEETNEFEIKLDWFKILHSHPPEDFCLKDKEDNYDNFSLNNIKKNNVIDLEQTKMLNAYQVFKPTEDSKNEEENKDNDELIWTREQMIAIRTLLKDSKIKFLITEMMARSNTLKYIHKKVQRYAKTLDMAVSTIPFHAFEMEFHKHYTYHNEPMSYQNIEKQKSDIFNPNPMKPLVDLLEIEINDDPTTYMLSNDDTWKQLRLMFPRSVILTSTNDQSNLLFLFKPLLPTNVVCIHWGYKLNNPELSLTVIWTISSNGHWGILGGVISIGEYVDFEWVKKAIKGLGGSEWTAVIIGGYKDSFISCTNFVCSTWHLYLELFNELKAFTENSNKLYDEFKILVSSKDEEEFNHKWESFLSNFSKLQQPQLEYLNKLKNDRVKWWEFHTHNLELFMHDSLDRNRYVFDIVTKSLHKFKSEKMSQIIQAIRLVKVIPYYAEDIDIDSKIVKSSKRAMHNRHRAQLLDDYSEYITNKMIDSIIESEGYYLSLPTETQKNYTIIDEKQKEFIVEYPKGTWSWMIPLTCGFPWKHLIKVILHNSVNTIEIVDSFIHERWRKHDGLTVWVPEKSIEDILLESAPTIPLHNVGAPTRLNRWEFNKRLARDRMNKFKKRNPYVAPNASIKSYINGLPTKDLEYKNRRRKEKEGEKNKEATQVHWPIVFSNFNFE